MPFAEVVFNIPLNHAYTYHIPDELPSLEPGLRVLAPFGKRIITGIVVAISETSKFTSPKSIIDVLDTEPLVSSAMMELTRWISEYYVCSWGQALQLALPKGTDTEEKEIIHLLDQEAADSLPEKQRQLYVLIGDHPDNSKDFYRKKFGQASFYALLNVLEKKGVILREKEKRTARVRELYRKYVVIPMEYGNRKSKHEDYLRYISRRPEIDAYMLENSGKSILMSQFLKDTSMASGTLKKMSGYKLCEVIDKQMERKPEFHYKEESKQITLTDEQKTVISKILTFFEQGVFKTFLLHGITGSGKTQVYLEIMKKTIQKGKTALVLIPEIALTPQTVSRFENSFPGQIAVFHSKMSPGERFDAWMSCYRGEVKIVVGPRSALFVPLDHLGLIVVDEEHETTYKQTDTVPRYHARDVAIYWAKMHHALVVLGSATPALESYFNARQGKYDLLEIRNRVDHKRLPDVTIIDLKKNRSRLQNSPSLFSEVLINKIAERIGKGEQIILLQNRRGYSSFMQCHHCGFIAICPHCDVTLTYHSFNERLQCHFCGHTQPRYATCPSCYDDDLVYKGVGTQRIQKELLTLFPEARLLRMDQDTTRPKNSHDSILNAFGRGEADILLGTQMIAKGLDFGNVTLVGVISADVGLAQPDFRAAERVFQLLTQVAGRSGRGKQPGEVVIQSYLFSHFAIQFARDHDYSGFYMHEMQHRQEYHYPPYIKMIQIVIVAEKMSNAINNARALSINLKKKAHHYCQVIGPAPAAIPRINKLYRWQVALKLKREYDPTGKRLKEILYATVDSLSRQSNRSARYIIDVDPSVLN